jgi:hypothetical protein
VRAPDTTVFADYTAQSDIASRGHTVCFDVSGHLNGTRQWIKRVRLMSAYDAVDGASSAASEKHIFPHSFTRDLGFFFCGLGPAFLDGADSLLLQWLSQALATFGEAWGS